MPIYGFSDQDVWNVVAFLVEEYIDLELDEEQAAREIELVNKADTEGGHQLIERYGCAGCHEKIAEIKDRGEIGVELTTIGSVHISRLDFGELKVARKHRTVPNWLYNKMISPRVFKEGLRMPDFSFSDLEAEAVTTRLLSLKGEEVPSSFVLPMGDLPSNYSPQGTFGRILEKYRCLICHKIIGKGGEMATDLTEEGSRVQREWLEKYMKTPYAIRPILEERMPRFKILDSEIEAVYSYFRTTLVDDRIEELASRVSEMPLDDPKLIRKGNQLFYEKYACNACHQINLTGGVIGPDLTQVGKRLRCEWLVYYLQDPKAFVERSVEPVYRFTDEEIEALAAFLVNPGPIGST